MQEGKSRKNVKKVVLAYSGGLDTSAIVPWLRETYNARVLCYCSNIGQGDQELYELRRGEREHVRYIPHPRRAALRPSRGGRTG